MSLEVVVISRRRLIYFEDREMEEDSKMVEGAVDGGVVGMVGWGEGVSSGWGMIGGVGLVAGGGGAGGDTTLETVGETLERRKMS